jgi:hypothetical protein
MVFRARRGGWSGANTRPPARDTKPSAITNCTGCFVALLVFIQVYSEFWDLIYDRLGFKLPSGCIEFCQWPTWTAT